MTELPDLSVLSHAEEDALIRALWEALQASERRNVELTVRLAAAERRIAELEARRHRTLADATRRAWRRRLHHDLDAVMALAPINRHGRRLRRRYGKVRDHLFTYLDHPEIAADNNGSERELRPIATYRKVTGGFRSNWGPEFFANVRSVVGTAACQGVDAYAAIKYALNGTPARLPG